MSRDERLRWIARNLQAVLVTHDLPYSLVQRVEPAELSAALLELVQLRAEKARNWIRPPTLLDRLRAWWLA